MAAATLCRAGIGPCDVDDLCDGASVACADVLVVAGTVCAPSGGDVCDADDVCTGSTADCPPVHLSGVECRAAAGACDSAETCGGSSPSCPPDDVEAAGLVCRVSADLACDPLEACDGTATACPADVNSCLPATDGGLADGGAMDGGTRDGGPAADVPAVSADAGSPPVATAGCACRAARPRPRWSVALTASVALLLGAAWARRRRRGGES